MTIYFYVNKQGNEKNVWVDLKVYAGRSVTYISYNTGAVALCNMSALAHALGH